MDSTVWRHDIHNACQDQDLHHPLLNPITIFNIHNHVNFTTLITNNHTYHHYDPLNLRPPPAINIIHITLRQWYTGLSTTPPLLRQDTPNINIQSTPHQTDGWTCGLRMLLVNLTTIYQGRVPNLSHNQHHAETLSISHLKYVLTRELDTYVTRLVRELTNQSNRTVKTSHPQKNTHKTH